jgi:hypothetical protein
MYLGETVILIFKTKNESGQLVNADALPTVVLYQNGNPTAETVTVTNTSTGIYKYTLTIPGTWSIGDEAAVLMSATIGGTAVSDIDNIGTVLYTSEQGLPSIGPVTCVVEMSDFTEFLDLQGGFKYSERLKPKALEAQRFDLKNILGEKLYTEVLAVLDNAGAILPETTFTQVSYDTILPFLKNYTKTAGFVRYLKDSSMTLTRFGPVMKKTPHSEPLEGENKVQVIGYYDGLAKDYASELYDYLNDNSTKFPLWLNEGEEVSLSPSGIDIISL